MPDPTSRETALALVERARDASIEPARRLLAEANVFATLAVEEAVREASAPAAVVTLGDLTVTPPAPDAPVVDAPVGPETKAAVEEAAKPAAKRAPRSRKTTPKTAPETPEEPTP